jgi:hypothetical protein
VVFAYQAAADELPALDPGGDVDGVAGLALWRFLMQTLVRTVPVVVPGVLSQHHSQVPLAEDQHVVEALAPQRAHEPLRVGVAIGDRTGVLITRVSLPEKTASNAAVNLGRVRIGPFPLD